MSCKLKSEILNQFKDQKLTDDQLATITKAIDLLTSVPRVIKTTKGSVYYHTTDENWDGKDLSTENELGLHVGTLDVARDYRKQALNKKVPNYLMTFEAVKDLNVVRLTDTTVELGGWDVSNVIEELGELGIDVSGNTLQDVQKELVKLGYDAIEYVNKAEINDGTVNSLIVMNEKAIKAVGKDGILDDEVIILGSEEDVFTHMGDQYKGSEGAYFTRKNTYRNKVVKDYRDTLVGTRVGVLDNETNKMVFKEVRDVVRTLDTYIDLVFADGIVTVDPETGITVDGFTEVDKWVKNPMYRGSEAKSGVFAEEYELGDLDTTDRMQQLVEQLNAVDQDAVSIEMVDSYKELIGSMKIEGFGKLVATLDKDAESTLGRYTNNKISVRIGKFKQVAGNSMSAAEVYVHELVHAYTAFALRSDNIGASNIRRKLRYLRDRMAEGNDWKMFMPEVSYDAKEEEANAKAKWKYVFENSKDGGLDEFIAHVLTHPILVAKAKSTKVQEQEVKKTLFDVVVAMFSKLMNALAGRFSLASSNKAVYDEVLALTHALGQINNEAVVTHNESKNVLAVVFNMLNISDAKISDAIKAGLDKLSDKIPVVAAPKNGSKLDYAKWIIKFLPQLVTKPELRAVFETVMSQLGMPEEGTVQNIIRDFRKPDDLEKAIDRKIMESGKIDRIRQEMIVATKVLVEEGFSKKLTEEQSEAVTELVLETDLQSIVDVYSKEKIISLMDSSGELSKEIKSVKSKIKSVSGERGTLYINKATALGMYMATGAVNEALALNADSIVIDSTSAVEERGLVDTLATLVALENSSGRKRKIVAELLNNEAKGVENVVALHKSFIDQSRKTLFDGSENLMQKGYVREILDDSVAIEVAPISSRAEMEQNGYEFLYELKDTDTVYGSKGMAMYKSKNFNRREYYRTSTRLTGMVSKGTTVSSIAYSGNSDMGGEIAALAKSKLELKRAKLEKAMRERELSKEELIGEAAPLYDGEGNVVDYRYVMSKDNKKSIFEQDKNVGKVLGRSNGSVYDKSSTLEHNKTMLKMMFSDMDENYEGMELGKNNSRYIEIGEDSHSKVGVEIWKILPTPMKKAIRSRKESNGKMFVRRDMLLNYFGFRHLEMTDSGLIKIMPKLVQRIIKIVEELWMAIVRISKIDVLLKTPVVVIDNIISNVLYGIMTGTDPITLIKLYISAGKDIREYINKRTELSKLIVAKNSGNVRGLDVHKINRLTKDLEANPIHELMELGIYESIMEDISDEEVTSNNVVGKWMQSKVEKAPEWAQTTWNWVALNEKTSYYKNMEMMLRMGDLLAQAAQNAKMKKINEQKLVEYKKSAKSAESVISYAKKLDDERREGLTYDYVFYGKPASSVEEYLNRMGLIMFTKYAKRIQRVIGSAVSEHPLKAVLMGTMDGMLGDAIPQVLDQTILDRSWYTYGINPLNHMEKLIPPMVRLVI